MMHDGKHLSSWWKESHQAPSESSLFLSSRSRHTRCSRDWSSDVCSSDLGGMCSTPFGIVEGTTRPSCRASSPFLRAQGLSASWKEPLFCRRDRKSVV